MEIQHSLDVSTAVTRIRPSGEIDMVVADRLEQYSPRTSPTVRCGWLSISGTSRSLTHPASVRWSLRTSSRRSISGR